MERPKFKIELAAQDKAVEILTGIALIALWAFAIFSYYNSPDIVPVHFDLSGNADGYADKQSVFILPVIGTLMAIVLTSVNQYPEVFNYPVTITEENALRQYTIATRMIRTVKLMVVLVFLIVDGYTFLAATGRAGDSGYLLLPALMALVFIPLLYYMVKAFRKS